MAMTTGQVCGEKCFHSTNAYYVYQPTGFGDWFRWRMTNAAQISATYDATYFGVSGVARGRVYAGHQDTPTDSDASSGFTLTSTTYGNADRYTTTYANYRDFNVPGGMTHVRLLYKQSANWGLLRASALGAEDAVLSALDVDCDGSKGLLESSWFALPSGTLKVRVHKAENNTDSVHFGGLDWINKSSEVDPDTAGSIMWAGEDVAGSQVTANPWWNAAMYAPNPQTPSPVVYWADDEGAYSANNSVGSVGHRGISDAVMVYSTQTGTDAAAAWEDAAAGDRVVGDYFIAACTGAKLYRENSNQNWRATLVVTNVFDASGWLIDWTATVDQGTAMDVFQFYTAMWPAARDVTYLRFMGDTAIRRITGNVTAGVKAPGMEMWGGSAGVVHTLEQLSAHDDLNYLQNVSTSYYPRIVDSTTYWKAYINRCYSTSAKVLDVANNGSLHARFAVRLRDKRLAPKRVIRTL